MYREQYGEYMHTDVWVKKKKKTFIYSGYPIQMP